MRVEDLDEARSRPAAVMGNLAELRWLGLDWDEGPDVGGASGPYLQSERGQHYAEALERLAAGHLVESFLSRREVAKLGEASTAAHRRLNAALAASRRAAGRRPSLRFVVAPGVVEFVDAVCGPQTFDTERDIGDFVVRRADGLVAYHLAVVVDDAAMGITEVARGADLLSSSAAQLLLYAALDLAPPRFAHVGLLLDASGKKLAKRHGAASLRELERAGVAPTRVLGLLARTLGWLPEAREITAFELLELLSSADQPTGAGAAKGGRDESHELAPHYRLNAPEAPYRLSAAELAWLGH